MKIPLCQTIQQARQHIKDDRLSFRASSGVSIVQQQDIAALEVSDQTVENDIGIARSRVKPAPAPTAKAQAQMGRVPDQVCNCANLLSRGKKAVVGL